MAEKIDLNSILADYENMMREEDPKVKAELRYEVSQKVRKTILDTKDPEEVNKIVDQLREKMAAVNNSNKENVAADAKEELLGKILNSDRAKHDRSINRIAFEYFWMKNSEQTHFLQ